MVCRFDKIDVVFVDSIHFALIIVARQAVARPALDAP